MFTSLSQMSLTIIFLYNIINYVLFLGLILVPNGEYLGYKMGDPVDDFRNNTEEIDIVAHRTSAVTANPLEEEMTENITVIEPKNSHPWGVFFTILGTVLLDFDADAMQSPSRAYLLDVTLPGIW